MKCYIEGKRNSKVPNVDRENGIAVANEISDLCGESFNVANEARSKSKKSKFNDTGLVAAVCRHDRVWYLVNMTEAGEKQYYMFAILDKIFQEIPGNFTVGFLHDLACQYHRSMMKWKILPKWANRILFGLPALHAYGHQFVCQITYHPHKIEAFGRTDGKGTERFWNSISPLICVC
ncbi:hypothetical protein BS47DRAFT_1292140 [Hydnum rufescens UP504]|uniref:Transposase n=1 Tax=Hydnum rufescens UP504 TaxID=1448309 RepID=A0A9P6B2M7_9AGAM|nr:hypothetical protein BS47DRAFT_1292140 [Hydnum rufescens UP504]